VWLAAPGRDEATGALLAALGELPDGGPQIQLLAGSRDLPGSRLLDLVSTMDTLRVKCPWDAKQTHETLAPHLIEESYEALEALEEGDQAALREELGDVLLQVAFHSRIAEEHPEDPFSIDDVAAGIVEKLIRRHPHVFGDIHAPTAEHVEANWEQIKAEEKQRTSVVEGVPMTQPALALAAKLASRARKAGVEASTRTLGEFPDTADAFGDLLLSYAVSASERGIDPEEAVRAAARRYRNRIISAEGA
jgi:XTP/dITP diphosphohydrolase